MPAAFLHLGFTDIPKKDNGQYSRTTLPSHRNHPLSVKHVDCRLRDDKPVQPLGCRGWVFGGTWLPVPIGTLSKIMRPPRPILPWKRNGGATDPFSNVGSGGGIMPAAVNFSGSKGFVNNKTGSRGSCKKFRIWPYQFSQQQTSCNCIWTCSKIWWLLFLLFSSSTNKDSDWIYKANLFNQTSKAKKKHGSFQKWKLLECAALDSSDIKEDFEEILWLKEWVIYWDKKIWLQLTI